MKVCNTSRGYFCTSNKLQLKEVPLWPDTALALINGPVIIRLQCGVQVDLKTHSLGLAMGCLSP